MPEPKKTPTQSDREPPRAGNSTGKPLRASGTSALAESSPVQTSFRLGALRHDGHTPLIPARILNEYVYCPRLAYLEWVQKEWEDSADTVEGRHVHRKVDKQGGSLPEPDEEAEALRVARSVELSSKKLNLIAKIDLVETEDGKVTPVDYKRGKRPHVARRAYDPERVQLCAQGLLLREHGYECAEGILYFAGSRERVRVRFDEELLELTHQSIENLGAVVDAGRIPPPLEDSPKCPRCSLVGVCLPDEVNLLRMTSENVRPLSVRHARALPVYVQSRHGKVAKKGERLALTNDDDETVYARIAETSQLVVMGNIYITTPTLHELMRRNIPVTWQSYVGWFLGHTVGAGHANVELRTAQYKGSFEDQVCLRLARGWVRAKIRNSRTLLRRNWRGDEDVKPVLTDMKRLADKAGRARDVNSLLGIEGAAAARYFQHFTGMLKQSSDTEAFEMNNRNRRPPTDPVNALLSFGYAMLTRTWVVVLSGTGFDPYRGFYHQPRYGRPALALDMMEAFRPLIVESAVVTAINNGEIRPTDFVRRATGVNLSNAGRKRFIATFERRLSQEVTHPLFGYRVEYRRLLEIQSRLLGRFLLGETPDYPNFTTR
ncbi:MAG: CRISPR-associated endonuclease Cas1 [Rhodospirillales bacterium]|nr:CRISPR-associated endonuclease Cas1 [Rhodospirillales bacterium]